MLDSLSRSSFPMLSDEMVGDLRPFGEFMELLTWNCLVQIDSTQSIVFEILQMRMHTPFPPYHFSLLHTTYLLA